MNPSIGLSADHNGVRLARRLLLGLALVVLTLAGGAKAKTAESVQDQVLPVLTFDQIVDDIENAHIQIREGQIAIVGILERDIAALTRLIDSNGIPPQYGPVVRYYRARAVSALNAWNEHQGNEIDRDRAHLALSDLQLAIDDRRIAPGLLKEAEYMAGLIAFNELEDVQLAFVHFARCSDLGHAGCINVMAEARVTGAGGMAVDIDEAVALHKQVYATGTTYTCAGSYSALSIAVLAQLGGVEDETGGWTEWMQNAYGLLDSLEEEYPGEDLCTRALFEIREYLLRLAGGEEDKDLLNSARAIAAHPVQVLTASYLLGEIGPDSFVESVDTTTDEYQKCLGLFAALWAADSRGDTVLARRFRMLLFELNPTDCNIQQSLSRFLTVGQ